MTINDMLNQGITLQGLIEVKQYDAESGEFHTVFRGIEWDGLMFYVDEPWADLPVSYIYNPHNRGGMTIEVGFE